MNRIHTISLIVPCKNEAKIIAGFVKRAKKHTDEVIIVDNNSTDATATIARNAGAIVVSEPRHVDGIGYGYAHQAGMLYATGEYIVAMDGDDTYPLEEISSIAEFMEKTHTDVVSCNRLPLIRPNAISKTRQFGIRILNTVTALLYGYPIRDILTGMWIINRKALHTLNIQSGGWDFSPEIKLAALTTPGITFHEYHIDHFERAKEPSKQQIWKTGFGHLSFIFQYRIHTWILALQRTLEAFTRFLFANPYEKI